jgi:hypothetical protein
VLDAPHCVHVSSEMGLTSIMFTPHLTVCEGIDVVFAWTIWDIYIRFSPGK